MHWHVDALGLLGLSVLQAPRKCPYELVSTSLAGFTPQRKGSSCSETYAQRPDANIDAKGDLLREDKTCHDLAFIFPSTTGNVTLWRGLFRCEYDTQIRRKFKYLYM